MRLAAALLCLVLGCAKKEPSQSAGAKQEPLQSTATGSAASSGSAGSSGSATNNDPWGTPAAPTSAAPEAPCVDADIQQHIDASLKQSMAYLAALEAKTKKWGKDCERAKKDLLALEPDATKFLASMQDFVAWGRTLSPACAKRVAELGDQRPEARDIEARTPGLEAKVTPILERCKDHPGFLDAAAKGLRVMQKKKPAP